jgi:membrane complex biogenesis BtpA family protein
MVHLKPLPGSPLFSGTLDGIIDAARRDAERILEAGLDGYIIENFGDIPFLHGAAPPHVIALLTRIALELPRGRGLRGVNVLRNDPSGALAVALAAGLDMIRVNVHVGAAVTDQGIIEGEAGRTLRERAALAPGIAILADVDVKHSSPLGARHDIAEQARDAAERGLADALIVTGTSTGRAASLDELKTVREAVPGTPILVGSGIGLANVRDALRIADGVIVGTSLKEKGLARAPVDPARARELVAEARR